jgi:hypothetical protein
MRRVVIVLSVVAIVTLVVTIGTARALDCHGRLVVIGASPWDVKERCGEPTAIEDVMKQFPQRAYDPISQTTVYFPRAGAAAHLERQFWLDALRV